jgi:transposase
MTRIHIESDQKEVVATLVKTSLATQCAVLQAGLKRTTARLKAFEQQFGQSSQQFYQAYQAGTTGDEEQIMEWAGEWETYQELTKALKLLGETEVC